MVDLQWYSLGDLVVSHNAARRPIKASERVPGSTPYYGASGAVDRVDGFTHDGEFLLVSEDGENLRSRSTPIAFMASGRIWVNNHVHVLTGRVLTDTRFLCYALASADISGYITGSAQPKLSKAALESIQLYLPDTNTRASIATTMGALDGKIAANRRAIDLLAELARAKYLLALRAGLHSAPLGDFAEFHNRRRIPLSSGEREKRVGTVPYYGAAGRVDFVDEAIFDDQLVLVGEDGTVMRDDGRPVVQYVWGPAWVNNHAHVLTGRGISTEVLSIALGFASVAHLVTGAVQPKLSMGRLKALDLEIPQQTHELEELIAADFALHRALVTENRLLANARDELLPLLMSGRVSVRDAEKVVEKVA
jgi:type I restriction enzyme, S subunit